MREINHVRGKQGPLSGIRVLDFTTLLPGPMATLMLAEAGAEVIKIERPDGEDMRRFRPHWGKESVLFAMLNRGKKSVAADLKDASVRDRVLAMAKTRRRGGRAVPARRHGPPRPRL